MSAEHSEEVALVTGGGSGIGAALCSHLAGRGTKVWVADVDEIGGQRVANDIGGTFVRLDVGDSDNWAGVLDQVEDAFGHLDALALNAGIMIRPQGENTEDDVLPWILKNHEKVVSVNLNGVLLGILGALHLLEQSARGRIVVTSSGVGLKPLESDPVYSMTKHGVIGLVRSIAGPLAERNVSIGAVCPGGVDTPMMSADVRATGRKIASASNMASSLISVLDKPIEETGGIWIANSDESPIWRYEFLSTKPSEVS
ncbi:MAG: SDR family NAD(P)-dependent oxidoreductase [Acidimicrobiales bacterium]|nr:SDR family oxidoreductase [Acidimicrobiales bacterium]MDG1846555.1 SDR family NAD(P)-dependent oxidoreductase [Acidimicrobiales bacterium]